MYMCSNRSFKLTPPVLWLQSITHKGSSVSLPLFETLCVSALWYVDTILTSLLSCHFSTVTGPECLAMISSFSNFLCFTSLGLFFLFSFSVPTQSVECSIFSFLANSELLKKLSIHSVCPRPNKGSKSSSTTAAILGVSGLIRLDYRTVFLPVYTRKHHNYPVLDSHSSTVFILNFEAFSGRYCFIDRRHFQSVKLSSLAMFWFGRYRVWNFMFK